MLHFLLGLALCIFIGERVWHYRALRRAASIILISGVAGMVLLFGLNILRSELRDSARRQQAAAAHVAPQCHPTPSMSVADAYKCLDTNAE